MPKRASPAVGHGDNLPEAEVYLRGLALEVLFQERKKNLREAHKRARKTIEGSGVALEDLDTLYKMRELTEDEIESWFRRKFAALGAFFKRIPEQFDLFAPRPSAPERKQAYHHSGRMAGLTGGDGTPPRGVTTEESNDWMAGFHEGAEARAAAQPVLAEILGDALAIAATGAVVDGTKLGEDGKLKPAKASKRSRKAKAVADQAAADFAADNPEGEQGQGENRSPVTSDDSPAVDPDSHGAQERLAEAGMAAE